MRKQCLNKNLLSRQCCFLFTCGNFILFSTVFSIFWIRFGITFGNLTLIFYCFLFNFFASNFFLSRFLNLFIVHSRPSFLFEPNIHFSLVVSVHMRHFDTAFLFFLKFLSDFCVQFIVRFSCSFCLVNENSLNFMSGLILLGFWISSSPSMVLTTIDFFNFSDFYCFPLNNSMRDVICSVFRSIAWLTLLEQSDFWTLLMKFY